MCNEFKMLARMDDDRCVEQCAHGQVHLVWKQLNWQLEPADLVTLTNTAIKACLHAGPPPNSRARAFRLRWNTVVMEFSAGEFWRFSELLRRATIRLQKNSRALGEGFAGWQVEVSGEQTLHAPRLSRHAAGGWMN